MIKLSMNCIPHAEATSVDLHGSHRHSRTWNLSLPVAACCMLHGLCSGKQGKKSDHIEGHAEEGCRGYFWTRHEKEEWVARRCMLADR